MLHRVSQAGTGAAQMSDMQMERMNLDMLQQDMGQLLHDVRGVRDSMREAHAVLAGLRVELLNKQQELAGLPSQGEQPDPELQKRKDQLLGEIAALEGQIDEQMGVLSQLEGKLQDLNHRFDSIKEKIQVVRESSKQRRDQAEQANSSDPTLNINPNEHMDLAQIEQKRAELESILNELNKELQGTRTGGVYIQDAEEEDIQHMVAQHAMRFLPNDVRVEHGDGAHLVIPLAFE